MSEAAGLNKSSELIYGKYACWANSIFELLCPAVRWKCPTWDMTKVGNSDTGMDGLTKRRNVPSLLEREPEPCQYYEFHARSCKRTFFGTPVQLFSIGSNCSNGDNEEPLARCISDRSYGKAFSRTGVIFERCEIF